MWPEILGAMVEAFALSLFFMDSDSGTKETNLGTKGKKIRTHLGQKDKIAN